MLGKYKCLGRGVAADAACRDGSFSGLLLCGPRPMCAGLVFTLFNYVDLFC